jgi:hypothetical protein
MKYSAVKGFDKSGPFTDLSKMSVNGQMRRINGGYFGLFLADLDSGPARSGKKKPPGGRHRFISLVLLIFVFYLGNRI